jgi:iduronate 2-sulfatase
MEWNGGELGVELYDVEKDPRELNNLASLSQFTDVKEELRSLLRELDQTAQ